MRTTCSGSRTRREADAIDDVDWPLVKEAGELGYLIVVNDMDSRGLARGPGVDRIVANATPAGDAGAVILARRRRRPVADRRRAATGSSR